MTASGAVSVVIPTCRRPILLAQALASVARQSVPVDEVVVVDDGPDAATAAAAAASGLPIRYERLGGRGAHAARCHGVACARGELIAFLDDDDIWLPQKLERQREALSATGAPWVYGDGAAFRDDDARDLYRISQVCPTPSGDVLAHLLRSNPIVTPAVVLERRLLQRALTRAGRPPIRYGEDWLTWLLVAAEAPVAYVPEVVCRFRVHASSITAGSTPHDRLRDTDAALAYLAGTLDTARSRGIPAARGLARIKAACALLAQGRAVAGSWTLARALLVRPLTAWDCARYAWSTGLRAAGRKLATVRRTRA